MRPPPAPPKHELLSWENLGSRPAADAFRESLAELIVHPGEFFTKMAREGGLHEPLTFFVILLCGVIVLSFPAALAFFGAVAPDPVTDASGYRMHQLPAQITGLLLVLLPVAAVVGVALMVVLGTLFHLPGKLFAPTNWEGSISVWLYSWAAALLPWLCAGALVLLVTLPGYLLTLLWPGTADAVKVAAHWWTIIAVPLGTLVGMVFLLRSLIVGCMRAFEVEVGGGLAVSLSGWFLVALLVSGAVAAFLWWSFTAGLITAAAVLVLAVVLTVVSFMFSQRMRESA